MNIKLHINQSDYLTNAYISEFTNHAIVEFEKINYDVNNKLAIIPLTRYRIEGGKKMLGLGEYPRNYNTPIQSSAIIRNIENAEFTKADNCEDVKEITLIFGITINNNKIYFSSAEEASGKVCYESSFFGSNLILELEDIEGT